MIKRHINLNNNQQLLSVAGRNLSVESNQNVDVTGCEPHAVTLRNLGRAGDLTNGGIPSA